MYWTYLGEVFKRAFAPTVRVTDGLQIAAASALPAIGKFLGIKMPETIGNDALSYIGAATLAFIVIRLFWAPYALWKDQCLETTGLRLELSKPERLVVERLAKHKAKALTKLGSIVHKMAVEGYIEDEELRRRRILKRYSSAHRQAYAAGLSMEFIKVLHTYSSVCIESEKYQDCEITLCEEGMIEFINGVSSIECLRLLLLANTEVKKQQ